MEKPVITVKIKTKTGEYVEVPAVLEDNGTLNVDIATVKHLL